MILTLIKYFNMSSKILLRFYTSLILPAHPKIENNIIQSYVIV